MSLDFHKAVCRECQWHGSYDDVLRAPDPFNPGEVIGCPKCREINTVVAGCDEPGCPEEVSCGTPTKDGYRSTCGKHCPK